MPEKEDEFRMPVWASEIAVIAGSFLEADTRESWLARAARGSKVGFRQVRALYYGETDDPKWSVGQKILSAASRARTNRMQNRIADRFEHAAEKLSDERVGDIEFSRRDIDALLHIARSLRDAGSA